MAARSPYSHYQRVMRTSMTFSPGGVQIAISQKLRMLMTSTNSGWRSIALRGGAASGSLAEGHILLTVFRKTREGVQRADVDRDPGEKTCQADHDMNDHPPFRRNADAGHSRWKTSRPGASRRPVTPASTRVRAGGPGPALGRPAPGHPQGVGTSRRRK